MTSENNYASLVVCTYHEIDDFGAAAAGKNPASRSVLLRTCIESLIKNTEDYPAEIIVVDNGGTTGDDTDYLLSKVREGKINTLVRFKENRHFSMAWNSGAALATGKYLSFVCNDIEFCPKWLSTCVKILEDYPEKEWLSTPFITYDKKKYTIETTKEGYRVNLRSGSNCMVIPRELFYKVGEFPIHRIGGSIWYNKIYRMGIRSVAPPSDLAYDRGWRQGVDFSVPVVVKKILLNGTEVQFEEKKQ